MLTPGPDLRPARDVVKDLVSEFINGYLAANPQEGKVRGEVTDPLGGLPKGLSEVMKP